MTIDPDRPAPGTRCESCGGDNQTGHQRLCKVLCDKYLPHVKEREYPNEDFFELIQEMPKNLITLRLTPEQYGTLIKELRKLENYLWCDRDINAEDSYSNILEIIESQGDPQNATN